MKKNIYFLVLILIFIIGCQQNEVIKTHGIAYLEKREKLIIVNESNKNDIIAVLGQPATKGMVNENTNCIDSIIIGNNCCCTGLGGK